MHFTEHLAGNKHKALAIQPWSPPRGLQEERWREISPEAAPALVVIAVLGEGEATPSAPLREASRIAREEMELEGWEEIIGEEFEDPTEPKDSNL